MQRRPFIFLCTAALLTALAPTCARANETPSLQDRVKAAFVFNFIQFTEWPVMTFRHNGDPLVIGILGETGLSAMLTKTVAAKVINGHPIIVKTFAVPADVADCQVLVVSRDFQGAVADLTRRDALKGLLTIGDFEGFTEEGGVIRFFVDDNKERFEINTAAAERAGLQISSKLLKLAQVIRK